MYTAFVIDAPEVGFLYITPIQGLLKMIMLRLSIDYGCRKFTCAGKPFTLSKSVVSADEEHMTQHPNQHTLQFCRFNLSTWIDGYRSL